MSRRLLLATALGVCLAASAVHAEVMPAAAAGPDAEPRIKSVAYDPGHIVLVPVPPDGIQFVFSPDETQFDVGLPGAWQWDRSQNTLYFQAGPGARRKTVYVVSTLPGGGNRRYQLDLIPVADSGAAAPPWQRPPGSMEAHAANATTVSDVMPDGPLPGAAPPPSEPAPAVVRFTYAAQEAEAKAEAARKRREALALQWQASGSALQSRIGSAQQARLRAEVRSSALAAAARKRCNVMAHGDARLMPRAICNNGSYTTFAYTGMVVPALFGVGPDGKDVKVQQAPVPGQPGLILARATFEFWRARFGNVQVAEFWDASYDPTGIPTTGTDTASPNVRLFVPDTAVRPAASARQAVP